MEAFSRDIVYGTSEALPMKAGVAVGAGAAVSVDVSGHAGVLQLGEVFGGMAEMDADNTNGGAGAKRVNVETFARFLLNVVGVVGPEDRGKDVFASGPNAFTLTQAGTGATQTPRVGKISSHVAGNRAYVLIEI